MECPYCQAVATMVSNSRVTKGKSQIWRRRKCLKCLEVFTTHEIIDLSHIIVMKKSGHSEMFSRMKLYSGIFYASQSAKISNRELVIDSITRGIEKDILSLKQKKIQSSLIAHLALKQLRKKSTPTFLRFLTYCYDITNERQLKRELAKYMMEA